ncbi:glycosyltransferase family 4 protein [Neobacillus piezotolerans]|uniref:Glycosyltransferase family 4 protein n=1 Tax=Neobacillus piezotolerans TaxID=2259171 RepID=A0A3D8GT61_9BACI|nr:glycosyltransferase [Neobacillus piezotolerans]RDU37557.1 glycosyltransferase family 4 protein [Neobacillus piezotolerans]
MKVAIVHDWLIGMGGAEKVILELHKLFPSAPIYTSVVNKDKLDFAFSEMDIRTTFIQRLPFSKKKYNRYLPFFPLAFEALDLREFDVIISSTASIGAKGVLRNSSSVHICYCHTPPRYAWDFYHEYLASVGKVKRIIIPFLMHYLRQYDQLSSNRVDYFIANSNMVKERIKKIYNRESQVIYPPVDIDRFKLSDKDEGFYLVISRLVPYKRIDLAIEACNALKRKLVIIGDGEEINKLKKLAGPTIEFLGYQSDMVVERYLNICKALIFPGYEDFGITPVEAQACGKPVIAYGKGGVLDTIIPNVTGILFEEQTIDALIMAIERFEQSDFYVNKIREHAELFSNLNFHLKFAEFLKRINLLNITSE